MSQHCVAMVSLWSTLHEIQMTADARAAASRWTRSTGETLTPVASSRQRFRRLLVRMATSANLAITGLEMCVFNLNPTCSVCTITEESQLLQER